MAQKQRVKYSGEQDGYRAKHGWVGWASLRDDRRNHHEFRSSVIACAKEQEYI